MTSEEGGALIEIRDRTGKVLVKTGYRDPTAKAVYKPRRSGIYYARVITSNDERGYPYKVSLSRQ